MSFEDSSGAEGTNFALPRMLRGKFVVSVANNTRVSSEINQKESQCPLPRYSFLFSFSAFRMRFHCATAFKYGNSGVVSSVRMRFTT